MATTSPEDPIIIPDSPKRNPSPIRHSSSSKRVKCTKDRIFEDPITEPDLKKTCHQCRQRSDFYVAPCKNLKKGKICCIKFCRKCLFNRYGEKVEDVALLNDWKCPKCRDVCNCSSCRKKKGELPTGQLVHTAKATGFTSVYEMLIGKGAKKISASTNVLKDINSSPKKQVANKETQTVASEKMGKENSFGVESDPNNQGKTCIKNAADSQKNGKENESVGELDSDFVVSSLSSDFGVKKMGVSKRKNIENVGSKGNASQGMDVSQPKNIVAKKSKVLKEQDSNSNKNGDMNVERKGSIIIEIKGSKKACNGNDNSQISTREEGRKSETSKNNNLKMATLKDNPRECIKKDGNADKLSRPCSVDEKKTHGSGTNDIDQTECSPTLFSIKKMISKREKSDAGVLPGIVTSKGSPTSNKDKPSTSNKEEKLIASQMLNFEVVSSECTHTDVMAEEKSSLSGGDSRLPNSENDGGDKIVSNMKSASRELKDSMKICDASIDVIPLPHGSDLTNVAGVDLPAEDVGHALQFLEFCSAFGKFFHLTKGQPETVLRDLTRGCSRRTRSQYSPAVQFHIQLLSFLLKDSGEEPHSLNPTNRGNSWLQALGKCISESACKFELPSNCFHKDGSGYNMLDSSIKLRILNFLCDEALCTADLRTWIDEKNNQIIEKEKEARQKVNIAKEKEKQAKQQLQDEIEKANANGSPLSLLERDELVSKMKKETENAHVEMIDAFKKIPQMKQRSDAVRTDSILFDGNGHVFWRLKCYSGQPDILVQDIGSMDSGIADEKWTTYEAEQKGLVDRYISIRGKRVRLQRTPKLPTFDI